MKQMRIIHGEGYSEKDRLEFIPCIALNVVKSMQAILAAAQRFGIEIEPEGQVCDISSFHGLLKAVGIRNTAVN